MRIADVGMLLVAASLLLGAAVAYLAELQLLVLMVFVGRAELGSSMRSAELRGGLRLQGGRMYGAPESEHFASMVPPTLMVLTLAVYVGLCGTWLGLMFALRDLPGGGDPWALLT